MKQLILMGAAVAALFGIHSMYTAEQWKNCIGNQSCYPYHYAEPSNLEELCCAIRFNALQGRKVRAIGNGYSISDIGCTDGCLISLKHLNKILAINLEEKTVRVEAGITLHDLNDQLAQHNLAIANQAAIAEITLGGALNTGVHGTGHAGCLSSFVREFELITADGTLHTLSLLSDPEAFAAVSVGLGSLGVIYAVTLQCESLFYLQASDEITDIDTLIQEYTRIHDTTDFCQFLWNIETGKIVINRWNRCERNLDSTSPAVPCYKALTWYAIDKNDKDLFSELAIPVAFLPDAIKTIQKLVQKYTAVGAKFADMNIRFVEQDKYAYLSPSSEGPVVCLAFCILEEDRYLACYREFEEAMSVYHGRPHWGKLNFLNYEKASNLYGENFQKFIAIKQKLDPQELFSNSFTDRIFRCKTH